MSINSLLLLNSFYLNSIKKDNQYEKSLQQQHQIEAYLNNLKVSYPLCFFFAFLFIFVLPVFTIILLFNSFIFLFTLSQVNSRHGERE